MSKCKFVMELPCARQLARPRKELSREARTRLALDGLLSSQPQHGPWPALPPFRNQPPDFYRGRRRYDSQHLATLEERSHRPHRRRRRVTWSSSLADRVLALRLRYPRWGKDKLAILLRQQKLTVSTSMVGRVLTQLKRPGQLIEAPRSGVPGSRRTLRSCPYAIRKPKQYAVSHPGDLVRVDTLEVHPCPAWSSSSSPPAVWSRAGT